ncbi:MAG: Holliday junction resolvase RecU [Bacillota bacterium]|nr:Holliday junction resolvase RecU [Bacillota bacterium]
MWGKRGLRGSDLETLIEFTNEKYAKLGLCRVDKIATPVKVAEIDGNGVITRGFFEKKSTVDFIGIIQGVFVAFDAKETNLKSLPLSNIHPHQVDYMSDVIAQGGLAFLIVHFKSVHRYFLVPFSVLREYMPQGSIASHAGKRKSIPFSEMDRCIEIEYCMSDHTLAYLDALNRLVTYEE